MIVANAVAAQYLAKWNENERCHQGFLAFFFKLKNKCSYICVDIVPTKKEEKKRIIVLSWCLLLRFFECVIISIQFLILFFFVFVSCWGFTKRRGNLGKTNSKGWFIHNVKPWNHRYIWGNFKIVMWNARIKFTLFQVICFGTKVLDTVRQNHRLKAVCYFWKLWIPKTTIIILRFPTVKKKDMRCEILRQMTQRKRVITQEAENTSFKT